MATPDIAGFKDAQERLRQQLGVDVTFEIPEPKTWGPDVAIDPESGEPFDPTTVPTSGGGTTEVVKRASKIFRPIVRSGEDSAVSSPIGVMDTEHMAVVIGEADYADVQDATGFTVNGKGYGITDSTPDGLDAIDRYIFYGQAR